MDKQKIRIVLTAFDHKILDQAASEVVNTAKRAGADVSGPIPMPTDIQRYIVNRSPHIDKKSREQFEIRTRRRVIIINYTTSQIIDALMKVDLAAGVDVQIKLEGGQA